jgi:hypothetical protein
MDKDQKLIAVQDVVFSASVELFELVSKNGYPLDEFWEIFEKLNKSIQIIRSASEE